MWGGVEENVLFGSFFQLLIHLRNERAGVCTEASYQPGTVR